MMGLLYVAIAGVAGLALGIALLERTIVRTPVGVGIVLGYFVLDLSGFNPEPTSVGSVNIGLIDLAIVLIVTAATARLLRSRLGPMQQMLLALSVIGLYSLGRGVLEFGPEPSVNEARAWLLFLGTVVYCSATHGEDRTDQTVVTQLQWAGVIVATIACIRWAADIVGISLGPLTPSEIDDLRVMPSDAAFLTGQAFLLTVPAWQRQASRALYVVSFLLLGVTVLLQHRTVWVAMVVTLAVLVWRDRELGRRLTTLLVVAAFAVAGLAVTLLGSNSDELTNRATNSQTLAWRIAGWTELLFENGPTTPNDALTGLPFGSGWERQVDDLTREERPHSQYIETFLRFGLVGLVLLIALYTTLIRQLLRVRGPLRIGRLSSRLVAYLLVFQMMFAITYVPPVSGAVVLGMAVATLRHRPRSRPDTPMTTDGPRLSTEQTAASGSTARARSSGVSS